MERNNEKERKKENGMFIQGKVKERERERERDDHGDSVNTTFFVSLA